MHDTGATFGERVHGVSQALVLVIGDEPTICWSWPGMQGAHIVMRFVAHPVAFDIVAPPDVQRAIAGSGEKVGSDAAAHFQRLTILPKGEEEILHYFFGAGRVAEVGCDKADKWGVSGAKEGFEGREVAGTNAWGQVWGDRK